LEQLITISPDVQSGTPVFFNTRVPVKNLFDYLSEGKTTDEFMDDFPSVSKQQIQKVLELVCNMVTFQFTGSLHEKSAA
jgi:uncharacterized protein (DUF433 family)